MGITLVVLAAGIGSRYGGLKQIDPVGPAGEIVIDYSIFDARRAGFDKIVCVIRREIERDFKACVAARFEQRLPVEYVFQELGDLPAGVTVPADRRKPWGTGHAILVCRRAVQGPFAVINADDFYGRESFRALGAWLQPAAADAAAYAMVGFVLRNTLSAHGTVARGVCRVAADGLLESVREHTRIEQTAAGARDCPEQGPVREFTGDELVSLNMWGFTPAIFPALEREFAIFLKARGRDPKAEFFVPTVVDTLIAARRATVRVLQTPDRWYGVTYPQDKAVVAAGIRELIAAGAYPAALWDGKQE